MNLKSNFMQHWPDEQSIQHAKGTKISPMSDRPGSLPAATADGTCGENEVTSHHAL